MSHLTEEYIMENIMELINGNIYFNTISLVIGMISFIQEALERWREKNWRKLFVEAAVLSIALAAFCGIVSFFPAVLIVAFFVLGMTFHRRKKCGGNTKAIVCGKTDGQIQDLLSDAMEGEYAPRLLDFSESSFKNAEQCLAENRPKAAIRYLNACRRKEKNQLRYVTRYVDALIMLENYEGALAKLNSLSARQINKKKRYKSVMVRKAACYYNLNRYMDELDCYDKIIAANYKPEKYYYYRGKIKTRLLGKYHYVKAAERAIFESYGSMQSFVDSALGDFEKALEYGDKYKAEILSYQGSCYYHLKERQKALDLFYESESLREKFENNHVYFGIYFYESEKFGEAKTYLENGIAYGASDEVPYLYLARICYQEKEYDEAIRHAAKALSLFSGADECHGIQGDCYRDKKMYGEAITCYTRAIDLNPKESYYRSRANCYYNKSDSEYRKALDDIMEAIKINDCEYNRVSEMVYRSKIDHAEGRSKDLAEIEQAVKPYAENAKRYNDIGLIFYHYGYLDEAEKYYRKAIQHGKNSESERYNLSYILRETGRLEEAVEHLETAIAAEPMNLKYYTRLEKCYRDLGDTAKESETQLKIRHLKETYLKINKENGDAVYRLGKYYAAEKYYRSALEYIPQDPAVLNNLSCVFYYQEKYGEAVERLEQAIAKKGNYLVYFNLGNCCLRMGDTERAASNYRTSQKLSSGFSLPGQMLQSLDPAEIEMVIDSQA